MQVHRPMINNGTGFHGHATFNSSPGDCNRHFLSVIRKSYIQIFHLCLVGLWHPSKQTTQIAISVLWSGLDSWGTVPPSHKGTLSSCHDRYRARSKRQVWVSDQVSGVLPFPFLTTSSICLTSSSSNCQGPALASSQGIKFNSTSYNFQWETK